MTKLCYNHSYLKTLRFVMIVFVYHKTMIILTQNLKAERLLTGRKRSKGILVKFSVVSTYDCE